MKLAILADIHGNYHALHAVLEDLNGQGIDEIVCLGDVIAIGPDHKNVLHTLMNFKNVTYVKGNHDEAVLALYDGQPYPESHQHARSHHEWVASTLTKAEASFLRNQPRCLDRVMNGVLMHFTHYAYNQGQEHDPISYDPYKGIVEPNLSNMEQLFKEKNSNIICFGHHHPTHHFHNQQTLYFNPGSLGCNEKPIAKYGIIHIDKKGRVDANVKEITYNRSHLLALYDQYNVPQKELLKNLFHGQSRSEIQ